MKEIRWEKRCIEAFGLARSYITAMKKPLPCNDCQEGWNAAIESNLEIIDEMIKELNEIKEELVDTPDML